METYSRGWRGAPAKGVDRETGARVQISLTPPLKKLTLKHRLRVFLFAKKAYLKYANFIHNLFSYILYITL